MSVTVQRLRDMRRGETHVYYRGHLSHDIDRSDDVETYRAILKGIQDTVIAMQARGVITVGTEPAVRYVKGKEGERIKVKVTEYLATRL